MNISNKKLCSETTTVRQEGFPLLPDAIVVNEIFSRLELNSLCSLSCVCRTLGSLVSQSLSTLPSLDLSAFSPDGEVIVQIVSKLRGVKSLTIDCLRLDDLSTINILGPHIQELNLLKCALLSFRVLALIGEKCPNLRTLTLELACGSSPNILKQNLEKMLNGFSCLEHLSIKLRGTEHSSYDLICSDLIIPRNITFLKLKPVNEHDLIQFLEKHRDGREISLGLVDTSITRNLGFSGFMLQHLSLVLNVISDRLIILITSTLPLLVDLDLEDRPFMEPKLPYDLTNNGLQYLSSCQLLTSLSIVRSRVNFPVSFKRINDLGVFLLSDSCVGLESIKLGGFSIVTDAGFSSLLRSCRNLKKFEVRNAPLLSDLAFNDALGVVSPLVEFKLLSCNLITSEAVADLAFSNTLEVIDTTGCRSIADSSLAYISCVKTLSSLNLAGADITDSGLGVLSKGDLPLVNLCLRGCVRVTDRGIICLLNGGERIKKTLSSLDIGHMPGVSDRSILAIVSNAESITELCIRYCFHVTDISIKALASERSDGRSLLRKLDLCNCKRLSCEVMEYFERPFFRGLRWLGVGSTSLLSKKEHLKVICQMRPWLIICNGDCEVGCHDGWQFHRNKRR